MRRIEHGLHGIERTVRWSIRHPKDHGEAMDRAYLRELERLLQQLRTLFREPRGENKKASLRVLYALSHIPTIPVQGEEISRLPFLEHYHVYHVLVYDIARTLLDLTRADAFGDKRRKNLSKSVQVFMKTPAFHSLPRHQQLAWTSLHFALNPKSAEAKGGFVEPHYPLMNAPRHFQKANESDATETR